MFVEEKSAKPHRKFMLKRFVILFCLFTLCQPSLAAKTDWAETEGGAMRLVMTRDGIGPARGVLQIRLEPGWKTYWRDPGDGGIPPSLVGKGMAVEFQFPAPVRINENGSVFSGYHDGVSLPFVLPEALVPLEKLTAFIGVCSDICVPFQAEFPLGIDENDAAIVDAAFAKLPKPAGPNEGIASISRDGKTLVLKPALPNSELFLAPEQGVYLSVPEAMPAGFTVKILKEKTPSVKVHYTLKTGGEALSGSFEMPK